MARTKFIVLLLSLMALAMLLVALNPQIVAVELAWLRWPARLGVVLVVAFAVGLITGVSVRSTWVVALLNERGRLRRALKAAESKVREYAAGSAGEQP